MRPQAPRPARRAARRLILPLLAVWLSTGACLPVAAEPLSVQVRTRAIEHFRVGSAESRFGQLEFNGGLELTSSTRGLGAMSSIRLAADRSSFLGVMDTGHWYAGRLLRDDEGRLAGVEDFSIAPMLDAEGEASGEKWLTDAEGLVIRGDEVLVSFERDHRIDIYPARDPANSRPIGKIPILIPKEELRGNRGLEAVMVAPADGPLEGATVAIAERSINPAGDVFAAVLDGPRKGVFFVHRQPPFDITDGDFLPGGDLILLERRFSIAEGIGMRLRRIPAGDIRPGATVDGEVLLETDFGYQIDNMEGLDATVGSDGSVYLTLVSDDNHSILQRNLILEFRLHDATAEAAGG